MPDSSSPPSSRRRFLKSSASAAAGFTLGFYLPGKVFAQMAGPGSGRRARGTGGSVAAERVRPRRRRQHGHGAGEASRNGSGHVHRTAHRGGRRNGRRLDPDPGRGRAGRRRALQQPADGNHSGHRRLDGDGQLVRSVAQGGRRRTRDAGRRGGETLERAAGIDRGQARRADARIGQEGDIRRTRRRRRGTAGAHRGQAEGSEGLRLHRQARAAHRLPRQVERHRPIHAGCAASRTCSPPWLRIRRASAPRWSKFSADGCAENSGRALHRGAAHRGRSACHVVLDCKEGARRAQDRVGRDGRRSRGRRQI